MIRNFVNIKLIALKIFELKIDRLLSDISFVNRINNLYLKINKNLKEDPPLLNTLVPYLKRLFTIYRDSVILSIYAQGGIKCVV
jgi:hypothetical protein